MSPMAIASLTSFSARPFIVRTDRGHLPFSAVSVARRRRNRITAPRSSYELREGQCRQFHQLPSGHSMEIISQKPNHAISASKSSPNLVFVHGSFHAAWCWAEHWLPFFSQAGFNCFALSLLGQGESDVRSDLVAGTLEMHAKDIADFIQKICGKELVLIGHSFGGLIVQSYIANMKNGHLGGDASTSSDAMHPKLAGAVLLCSVPPTGNSGLVWRYLLRKPISAIKVTLSLAAKAYESSLPLCKETFFSAEMEDQLVRRYQALMKQSSKQPLFDLRRLNASLPVPSVPKGLVDVLVLGASDDFIVDNEGLQETARFYNVDPVCVEGVAHDMMLDCSWQKSADIILSWLKKLKTSDSLVSLQRI